jgi:hypothetical protein
LLEENASLGLESCVSLFAWTFRDLEFRSHILHHPILGMKAQLVSFRKHKNYWRVYSILFVSAFLKAHNAIVEYS